MRKDLTDITLVVDRSGSMASIRTDAEGGVNTFIEQQKTGPGEAVLTLVQFDNVSEILHSAKPIRSVPSYTLEPRGSTALLDAVGKAILETGNRLSAMREEDRPGLVVFVIVTDGQENASREFNRAKIREMIQHQQSVYNWQFTFLAANQDAFAEGGSMGIQTAGIANFAPRNIHRVYGAAASNVSRMRSMSAAGEQVKSEYTAEEKKAMES
jgi:hypothetical protein